jgi:heat shock protein HtpX
MAQNVYQHIGKNKWKTAILMSVFFAVIATIGWFMGEYYGTGGYGGLILAAGIATVMSLLSYFAGDKVALMTAGAQKISREDHPTLWNTVENMSITAGIPMPAVYIIPDSGLNAFATGRNPENASVAFTTGLLDSLENEELEGVVAHELSHIGNYDIRVMMVVIVLVGTIALLADMLWRAQWFGGKSDNRDSRVQLAFMVVGLVLIILSPIIAELIKLAISRKRESLADASAVLLTRYSEGLIGALRKIEAGGSQLKRANTATAHLFLASPFKGKGRMKQLFSTHPPIAKRIAALEEMKG